MKKKTDVKQARHQLDLLFNPDEYICLASSPYDTAIKRLSEVTDADIQAAQWVALNPFEPGKTRADANVEVFRNILIEMDDISLESQIKTVEAAGLPFTTQVWSGSKSYHYVISFDNPIAGPEAYKTIVEWIYAVFADTVDTTCRNPSRFTRLAGAWRSDKKQLQKLECEGSRLEDKHLDEFLSTHNEEIEASLARKAEILQNRVPTEQVDDGFRGKLTLRTRLFMRSGTHVGGRHKELYYCACDFKNNNYQHDEALELLYFGAIIKAGLTDADFYKTIESAYSRAPIAPRM